MDNQNVFVETYKTIQINLFLPSATGVAERLCFHKRLSFCPHGGCTHPPAKHTPLGRHPRQADTPLPQTATAADGAHPTGMHSFFLCHLTLFFHLPSSADSIELVNI